MKDLIAKLKLDANCALGAIWMHIDAQAARIAELEAQIAAASEPAVEQQPVAMVDEGDDGMFASILPNVTVKVGQKLYAAPKQADTDKLRETYAKDAEEFGDHLNTACWAFMEAAPNGSITADLWNNSKKPIRAAILKYIELVSSTALQAPVREVPDSNAEKLGETCIDGGKCHHECKYKCFRRDCCSPLSDYTGPWAYPALPAAPVQEPKP